MKLSSIQGAIVLIRRWKCEIVASHEMGHNSRACFEDISIPDLLECAGLLTKPRLTCMITPLTFCWGLGVVKIQLSTMYSLCSLKKFPFVILGVPFVVSTKKSFYLYYKFWTKIILYILILIF